MIDIDAIRAGLNGGEFFVEYLPTIDVDSDRCVGAEALTRWRQDSGAVNPFEVADLTQASRCPAALPTGSSKRSRGGSGTGGGRIATFTSESTCRPR